MSTPQLDLSTLQPFKELQLLNLSSTGLENVTKDRSDVLQSLRIVDLRKCPMTSFPRQLFHNMTQLHTVHAENFKLCCRAMLLQPSRLSECTAPQDEISSCKALLRSNVYRAALSMFAFLALLGNSVSFLARLRLSKEGRRSEFQLFVLHLCVSDFLMGVYLSIVGVADRLYLGTYLWEDVAWRHSGTCLMAGFTSQLSCEVSAFIICLFTLDRLLVLCFPFSRLRFSVCSAQCAAAVGWVMGLGLASVPLVSHWQFYSQTGICVPLPVTR